MVGCTSNVPMNVAVFVRPATPPIFVAAIALPIEIVPLTVTTDPDAKFAPAAISPTIPPIFAALSFELSVSTLTSIVPANVFSPLNVVVTCFVPYASV